MTEVAVLVSGTAEGDVVTLDEPLSLWGGLDPATGDIIDVRHPQRGARVAGRMLLLPAGRGSSSSSTILAEAIRAGTAPAAIVLGEPDPILALGAIVGRELYGTVVPIVVADRATYVRVGAWGRARVDGSELRSLTPDP
ncbi:MAG: aconitase X swivel domain-containing protein [Actinomycetota bacterium]